MVYIYVYYLNYVRYRHIYLSFSARVILSKNFHTGSWYIERPFFEMFFNFLNNWKKPSQNRQFDPNLKTNKT